MKKRLVASLLFTGFLVVALSVPSDAQGIGGLIKRKAAEAVGADKNKAPDPKQPITSSTDCAKVTDDILDRFIKGLEAEVAENQAAIAEAAKARQAADEELARAKPKAEFQSCQIATMTGPEGAKISEQFTNSLKGDSQADGSKLMTKYGVDMAALTEKRCGKSEDVAQQEWKQTIQSAREERLKRWNQNSAKIGAKTAGLDEACYSQLKERAIPFCKLSKDLQKEASTKGIKGDEGVYTPEEAKAYASRCPKILSLAKDIDL